jgi:hypothetical protein
MEGTPKTYRRKFFLDFPRENQVIRTIREEQQSRLIRADIRPAET